MLAFSQIVLILSFISSTSAQHLQVLLKHLFHYSAFFGLKWLNNSKHKCANTVTHLSLNLRGVRVTLSVYCRLKGLPEQSASDQIK